MPLALFWSEQQAVLLKNSMKLADVDDKVIAAEKST